MDEYSEADEIADSFDPPIFATWNAARYWVRTRMLGQSIQTVDNVTDALWEAQEMAFREKML